MASKPITRQRCPVSYWTKKLGKKAPAVNRFVAEPYKISDDMKDAAKRRRGKMDQKLRTEILGGVKCV